MKKQTRKQDATDKLYTAVANYVKAHGGNVVVIGAVQQITWPFELEGNFTLGVQCTGKRMTKPDEKLDKSVCTK